MKKQIQRLSEATTLAAIVMIAILSSFSIKAQTVMSYGDALVVGWNNNSGGSGSRQFQIVLLKNATPGTVLKFANHSFYASSTASTANNIYVAGGITKWTNTTGGTLAAGTVISFANTGTSITCDTGTASAINNSTCNCGGSGTNPITQSSAGGKIFIYQSGSGGTTDGTSVDFSGSTSPTTFNGNAIELHAFQGTQTGYTTWLTSGTANGGKTYLPSDLTSHSIFLGSNAIGGYYSGPRTGGTIASYRAAILNPANWTTVSGTSLSILDSTYFTFGTTLASTPQFMHLTDTLTVLENSTTNPINTKLAAIDTDLGNTDIWSIAMNPLHGTLSGFPHTDTSTGSAVTPFGLTYTPSGGYSGPDTFAARIYNGYNSDTITIYVNVRHINAVASLHAAKEVAIYPNPTSSVIQIDAAIKVNVVVLNSMGRVILKKKDAREINLSDLADGTYLIQAYDEDNHLLKTEKILKTAR